MKTVKEEIKTFRELGKKYNVAIPPLDAERATPPTAILEKLQAEITFVEAMRITHTWKLGDGQARIRIVVVMSWSNNYPLIHFDLTAINIINFPRVFADIIRSVIREAADYHDEIWEQIIKILNKRADVKQFNARVRKLAKKLTKLEQQYPGFDAHDWFDVGDIDIYV
jgi:hypothetical protein